MFKNVILNSASFQSNAMSILISGKTVKKVMRLNSIVGLHERLIII